MKAKQKDFHNPVSKELSDASSTHYFSPWLVVDQVNTKVMNDTTSCKFWMLLYHAM